MAITAAILGGNVQLTGNPVYIECTGGAAPAGSSGYKILLRVISEDGKLEGAPFEDAIAPDDSGSALFDISGYVDQPVDLKFQWPLSGHYTSYPTQAFNVQVQPGEYYIDSNGDPQTVWGSVSSVVQMLKGGNSPRQNSMMSLAGDTFYSLYVQGGKWLTGRPDGGKVTPNQPIKIWYMVSANTSGNFVVDIRRMNGDTAELSFPVSLDVDRLYEFNVNPEHLGFDLENPSKILYFGAQLQLSSGYSDRRSFWMNWEPIERPVFLFCANSLGGIDDVMFSGDIQMGYDFNSTVAQRPSLPGDTVFIGTRKVSRRTGVAKWVLESGYKGIAELRYYADLLLSKQAWYIHANSSYITFNVIPIIVETANIVLVDWSKDIHSLKIEVSEAHESPFSFDYRLY